VKKEKENLFLVEAYCRINLLWHVLVGLASTNLDAFQV
jgi:hypothetical protein